MAPGVNSQPFVQVESNHDDIEENDEIANVIGQKDYDAELFDNTRKTNEKLNQLYKNSILAVIDYDKIDNTNIPDMDLNDLNNQMIAQKVTKRMALRIYNSRHSTNKVIWKINS